ncbi:hypothetical protein X949_5315 [Burkholderia pseudomallei MSHR5609]|nr:hypothetical protein DM75_2764 [Burkholderia mallei]KGS23207.1 hypothetical protein X962_5109 [Burkholderia pseudomallei MSHR7343]KGS54478.1 hypothetical protein X949_5315 [Burkholderia pseudomallei MSHR5609]
MPDVIVTIGIIRVPKNLTMFKGFRKTCAHTRAMRERRHEIRHTRGPHASPREAERQNRNGNYRQE